MTNQVNAAKWAANRRRRKANRRQRKVERARAHTRLGKKGAK